MTQQEVNSLSYRIIGCAIEVHKRLGPGLLESVYEKCMIEELKFQSLNAVSQQQIPIVYRGKEIDCNLRFDLLVNDCIIVELKAVEEMLPLHKAQLLTYLKLLCKPKGLLINFNCSNIQSQVVSLVTEEYAKLEIT